MVRSILIASLLGCFLFALSCKEGPVKPPAVAGAFYPADKNALRAEVREMLASAPGAEGGGRLVALISPHAGYVYSGAVAAHGYKQIVGKRYRTVVVIGSSHRESYKGAAVLAEGSLATPLGNIRIDGKAAKGLLDEAAGVRIYERPFEKEHSLEVQLPFLQVALEPGFRVVPVLIGMSTKGMYESLSARLASLAKRDDVLLVASTDLSHYHGYDAAVEMDSKLIDAFRRLSTRECMRLMGTGESEMCGANAVLVVMEAARRLGANRAEIFSRANSGDVTGDRSRVVGYASAGLYVEPLSDEDRKYLLGIARTTVTDYVTSRNVPENVTHDPRLLADGAVFVTINMRGRLRGCIGDVQAYRPLIDSIVQNAVRACSMDPRFPPMVSGELEHMELEISILSHLTPVGSIEEIEVGRHGLMLVKGRNSGLLLPQVPGQFGWDRDTFLDQLAKKAGLPPDAWREGATIYRFTADVFHE
jgi:AmmeMemoRadiSam system protein B/AmmeMemoRadiSam system protein A